MRLSFIGGAVSGALLASVGLVAHAADPNFRFVTDSSSYSIAPGGSVNVDVYLEEQLNGAASSLIVGGNGLFSFGYGTVRTGGNLPITAQVSNAGFTATGGSQWANDLFFATPGDGGAMLKDVLGAPMPSAGVFGAYVDVPTNQVYRVYLGTLTITAPMSGGIDSTYYIRDPDELTPTAAGFPDSLTHDGVFAADTPGYAFQPASTFSPNVTSFSVTVDAVPEAATLGMLAIAGVPLLWRRRR